MSKSKHSIQTYQNYQQTPSSDHRGRFQPGRYFQIGWQLIKKDPWVIGWRILADICIRGVWFLPLLLVVTSLFSHLYLHHNYSGKNILDWFVEITPLIQQPAFLIGIAGIIGTVIALTWVIDTFVSCGIWGVLATGLNDKTVEKWRTFFVHTQQKTLTILGLKLLHAIVQLTLGLLFVGIFIAALPPLNAIASGELISTGPFAIMLALVLSAYLTLQILVRLTFSVISAPIFIDNRDLGDAVLHAANFAIFHIWQLYRLVIYSLLFILVPLLGYWAIIMLYNVALMSETLVMGAMILRFLGEILLFLSFSAVSVLFGSAVFSYYAEYTKPWSNLVVSDHSSIDPKPQERLMNLLRQVSHLRTKPGAIPQGVTLAQLQPEKTPYIQPISKVMKLQSPNSDHEQSTSENGSE